MSKTLEQLRLLWLAFLYLFSKLTRTKRLVSLRTRACKFPVLLRVPSSDLKVYAQIFIDEEYRFQVAQEPEVIVDAGANIGLAAIYFANKYPRATIIAIEPEQGNFELLKRNVAPYPNIVPVQAALSDVNGELAVVDGGLGEWGFTTYAAEASVSRPAVVAHSVPAITVDVLMTNHGLSRIDILKVDIEGAEKDVFRDTAQWIEKVNSIIIELHERMRHGCNRSFYCGTPGFDGEWIQGENVYLTRQHFLSRSGVV